MFENTLPIGTIVALKKSESKIMIIGIKQVSANKPDVIYDYIGVVYPAGSLGVATQFLFNQDDIADVVFKGYTDSEWDEMISALEKEVAEKPELAEKLRRSKE